MKDAAALDQLSGEARAVDESLKATQDLPRDEEPARPGSSAGPSASDEGQAAGAGAAPHAEVIENPAPKIAAVLRFVVHHRRIASRLPAPFVAALDDASIEELSEAFGDVAVKRGWTLPGGKWAEELRLLGVLAFISMNVLGHAGNIAGSDDASSSTPAAPGEVDPPNPAAGQKPVEPGAG